MSLERVQIISYVYIVAYQILIRFMATLGPGVMDEIAEDDEYLKQARQSQSQLSWSFGSSLAMTIMIVFITVPVLLTFFLASKYLFLGLASFLVQFFRLFYENRKNGEGYITKLDFFHFLMVNLPFLFVFTMGVRQ